MTPADLAQLARHEAAHRAKRVSVRQCVQCWCDLDPRDATPDPWESIHVACVAASKREHEASMARHTRTEGFDD